MDEIGVGITSSGADGIDKLISKLDQLDSTLLDFGKQSVSSLASVAQMMETLQSTMVTGFTEMAAVAQRTTSQVTAQGVALKAARAEAQALAGAQKELNSVVKDAEGAFRGAAHQVGLYGLAHGQLLALLAGGAAAAALHKIAVEGAEVEYNLQFLKSFSDETKPLDFDRFIGISSGTLSNIKQAAEGVRALAEAGLDQTQALSALPDLLRLSALGELDVAHAAEVAVESLRAFGLNVADVAQVSDVLIAVSTKTNISVKTLANDLKTTSTTFAEFGGTLKDAAVLTGALAEKGLSVAPLSSALTGLIEPSKKQLAVLQQIGFAAKDAEGNIKPLLQIISEFNEATSKYKNTADIFAPLGGPRAAKALQAVSDTQKLLELTKEVDESAGKTFDAYLKQIDDVEGAFKQLSSTVHGDFNRAFEAANPLIRQVEASLLGIAQAQGTQDFLSGLAVSVTRLTQFLIDHAKAIEYVAFAYAGLKVVAVTEAALKTLSTTMAAATVEIRAAAGAITLVGEASGASAGFLGVAALAARGLMAALGPIAIAIGVATIAYELLNNTLSDNEKASLTAATKTDQLTEAYAKHTAEVKRNNDELVLNAQLKAGGTSALVSATGSGDTSLIRSLSAGSSELGRQQAELAKQQSGLSGEALQKNIQEIIELHKQDLAIQEKLATFNQNDVSVERARAASVAEDQRTAALRKGLTLRAEIEKLDGAAHQVKSSASAEAASRLADIQKEAAATAGQVVVTDELSNKVKDFQKFVKDNKLDFIKPDQGAIADALKATIDGLKQTLVDAQKDAATAEKDIQSQLKQGSISAIEAYGRERDLKVAALEAAKDEALQVAELNKSKKNGVDAVVKAKNAATTAEKGIAEANAEYERKLGEDATKIDKEGTAARVAELKKRGDFADAYALQNADKVKALDLQITDASALLAKAWESDDNKKIASSARVLSAALTAKERFDAATNEMVTADNVHKSEKEFTDLFSRLSLSIDETVKKSSASSGLPAIFNNALEAERLYAAGVGQAIAKQKELQDLATANPGKPEFQSAATAEMKKIEDEAAKVRNIWVTVGKDIETALTDAFGNAGKALGGLLNASIAYANKEQQINADLEKSRGGDDFAAKQARAASDLASAQVHAYGDMAGAAKNFFEVGSSGYNKLATIERAYRAAELVMSAQAMVTKLFETTTVTAAKVTAATVEGAAAAATVPIVLGAEAAKSSAYGITALAASLDAPFPANIAAFATVAAMLAAIGVVVSGAGHADTTAVDRQAAQGTGTVLGSPNAKSESIVNSLNILEKNSTTGLDYSSGMLDALRGIESSIGGLGNLLVRAGLTNATVGTGTSRSGVTNLAGTALGALGGGALGGALVGGSILSGSFGVLGGLAGPVGAALGALVGGVIGNLLTNVKTSLVDQGLNISPQSLGATVAGGVRGSTYSDVNTSKSFLGITYSNSTDRNSAPLSSDISQQFTAVISSIRSGISAAAVALGDGGDAFLKRLDSFVVSIPNLSLKGLTGDQIQKQLEAVFGTLGDNLAKQAIPGLDALQKVGEGYLETLTRVAVDYQSVDAVMKLTGQTFSQVGFSSIGAREQLIELSGGLDKFISQGQYFAKNFLSAGEQLDILRNTLSSHIDVSVVTTVGQFESLVKGLDKTSSSYAQQYADLMALAPAFKQFADTLAEAAQKISDERRGLQDQLDQLTMTPAQLADKQRSALDVTNRALFDQVQAAQAAQDAVQKAQKSSQEAVVAAQKAVDDAVSAQQKRIDTARSNLTTAYNAESTALKNTITQAQAFAKTLRDFSDSLKLGANSPLSPTDQYAEARRQFETADPAHLQAASTAFLDASKAYNASTEAYSRDFNQVQAAVGKAATAADAQVTIDQQQLKALDDSVAGLGIVNASVLSVRDAIAQFVAASKASDVTAAQAKLASVTSTAQLGPKPARATAADYPNLDPSVAAMIASGKNQLNDWYFGPSVSAHANGGIGSGWSLVGEQGPELVNFTQPGRVYTASQSRDMLGGSGAASEAVAELLRDVLVELRADKTQRAALGSESLDRLDKVVDGLAGNKREMARSK